MRCPACGAFYHERSTRCPECGALQNESQIESSEPIQTENLVTVAETVPAKPIGKRSAGRNGNPSLIEFPGVNRNALPAWRKELGERVREVQERRAREALEGGTEPLFSELDAKAAPMLELLPQTEAQPVNPLVVAALRRIERAYSHPGGKAALAAAVVYDDQPEPELALSAAPEEPAEVAKPERFHNLAVVPSPITVPPVAEMRKPRGVLDEQNPALNYLDFLPTSVIVDNCKYRSAPVYLRILVAFTDLLLAAVLSTPVLALTQFTTLAWANPRLIGFAIGSFGLISFLYLTVSTAFTGRTAGMKLFGLRTVDTRTGLIPTGSQSAGRALLFLLSLASAGLLLLYALLDSDRHAAHDRFTRTAVVRA
jgi:uncharacterized RDD family membrane protein YckC